MEVYLSRGPAERAHALITETGVDLDTREHTLLRIRLLARAGEWERVVSEVEGLQGPAAYTMRTQDAQLIHLLYLFARHNLPNAGFRTSAAAAATVVNDAALPERVAASLSTQRPELRTFLDIHGIASTNVVP